MLLRVDLNACFWELEPNAANHLRSLGITSMVRHCPRVQMLLGCPPPHTESQDPWASNCLFWAGCSVWVLPARLDPWASPCHEWGRTYLMGAPHPLSNLRGKLKAPLACRPCGNSQLHDAIIVGRVLADLHTRIRATAFFGHAADAAHLESVF